MRQKESQDVIIRSSKFKFLLADVCSIIESSRECVATAFNFGMTMMYWSIGARINKDVLNFQRAAYGERIVSQLATQLQERFGSRGFEHRNLRRMMQFSQLFPDEQIVSQLATQLSWSHFIELLPLKDDLAREFYLTLSAKEKWGRNRLRKEIDGMLYERTAISKKPRKVVEDALRNYRQNDKLTPDVVFKSPYFLDFTGLSNAYSEKNLEDCLLSNLEQFMIELGNGFCFVARQKRMIIDGEDFYLDLLFYHRRLHRLIAVDLKLGRFKAQYKGQMELYLRWLEENEKQAGEKTPLGLLLCTEGNSEQIELLQLDKSGIRVAQYLTELPPRKVIKEQLKKAIALSKTTLIVDDKNR